MIRRKIWATATCLLAVAGAVRAQDPSPKATLGKPVAAATLGKPQADGMVTRGVAPNPGYPQYVPRNYTQPSLPGYGPSPALDQSVTGTFASEGTVMSGPVIDSSMTAGAPAQYLDSTVIGDQYSPTRPRFWVIPEVLNWQSKGAGTPPLVTVAPSGAPGTLDSSDTGIAYGGDSLLQNWEMGLRLRAGISLGGGDSSIEASFMFLGRNRDDFARSSNGSPGLFRPFLDVTTGTENSQLLAFNDPQFGQVLAGGINVAHSSDLLGGELNYRRALAGDMMGSRFDVLIGYRYMMLRDVLSMQTNLTAGPAAGIAPGTAINGFDRFETTNQFHGAQIGFENSWQLGRWGFGLRATTAVGWTHQRIEIDGNTATSTGVTGRGSLFALPSNIGTQEHSRFSIIPEVGATVGFNLSPNCRIFGGYNFLYWTNVTRAAEQVDRRVNPTLIPDPAGGPLAPAGSLEPVARRRDTGYWAHGWSLGVEWKW